MVKTIRAFLLRLILENAIVFEEKAYEFYESAENRVEREEVKHLLRNLKAEELKHRLRIEEAQQKADINLCCASGREFGEQVQEMKDDWPEITPESSKSDILEVAYRKELQARDFYASLKAKFPNSFVKSIFEALEREEERHALRIAEKMG